MQPERASPAARIVDGGKARNLCERREQLFGKRIYLAILELKQWMDKVLKVVCPDA